MRDRSRHALFLTGASGLVGSLLLRQLAEEEPSRAIYALIRNGRPPQYPNVRPIAGDLTQPEFGLPHDTYAEICRTTDTVVHCAAATKFMLPLEEARRVNVSGTANVLQLSRRAPNLRLFLHVSSTYIAGQRSGPLHEARLQSPVSWFSAYEQSKWEAEELIADCAPAGLPWAIARLSTLIGDSQTGEVRQPNYFHQLLRLVPRNPFPIIPAIPESLVDVVADNWVAKALAQLVNTNLAPGTFLHLCAGPRASLTASEAIELAFAQYRRRDPGFRGIVPTFVDLEEFRRYTEKLRQTGQDALWRMSELLLLYLPHLERYQPFLNEHTNAFLATRNIAPANPRDFLPLLMQRFWR